jgi:hypothetical protein
LTGAAATLARAPDLLVLGCVADGSDPQEVSVALEFGLYLFSTDEPTVQEAVAAGVDGIVIDWENMGKRERQAGADTQINYDSPKDLARIRSCTDATVLCRINAFSQCTAGEVARAIDCGADELLLPMVRTSDEVRATLDVVSGRVDLGILVETSGAITEIDALVRLPISRVYVGLNDLAIDRRLRNIFESVADGTVESLRESCDLPFGFAGLTLPHRGSPIPCRLLINEMARLRCNFSFLRRSFHADVQRTTIAAAVPAIREAMTAALDEPKESLMRSRAELLDHIRVWGGS